MFPLFLLALTLSSASATLAPTWDVVLIGPTSNLAAKYLWQSLFHLHCETGGGLRIHAAGRDSPSALRERVHALLQLNTSCGMPPTLQCQEARTSFASSIATYSTAAEGGLSSLGSALTASSQRPQHRGSLLYFAVASGLVPPLLRALSPWVDLASPGTRVVVEKPVGSSRASAGALLGALQAPGLPHPSSVHLMDHYLAKAGLQLAAGARWALGAAPAWRAALATPLLTEAWAMEDEDCSGRSEYYNTAGAVRDMLVTHLTLAAAAALQPPGHSARVTPAARAGVLAALQPSAPLVAVQGGGGSSGRLAVGTYTNASAHSLAGPGAVTAAGAVLELRDGSSSSSSSSSSKGRLVLWTGKALGWRGAGVRQVLRLAVGGAEGSTGAAEAQARAACGPVTVTYHYQGQVLPPSPGLERTIEALLRSSAGGSKGGSNYPALIITGLCGATGVALGDPAALLARLKDGSAGGWGESSGAWRWEVRSDVDKGVWVGSLVIPPATPELAVQHWASRGLQLGALTAESLAEGREEVEDGSGSSTRVERLMRLALRPSMGGGEAYTSAIASALLGRAEAFLSVEETDRLWALWDGLVEEADSRAAGGGAESYAPGEWPSWMRAKEAGRTLREAAGGEAAGGRSGEL